MLSFIVYYCHLDPCFQPVGISNGLSKRIGTSSETISNVPRFITPLGSCTLSYVSGILVTPMTIKGIAFRSNTNIELLNLDYAFFDANPWIPVYKSSRTEKTVIRVRFFCKD